MVDVEEDDEDGKPFPVFNETSQMGNLQEGNLLEDSLQEDNGGTFNKDAKEAVLLLMDHGISICREEHLNNIPVTRLVMMSALAVILRV